MKSGKAVYSFNGETENELTFKVNCVSFVFDEILIYKHQY